MPMDTANLKPVVEKFLRCPQSGTYLQLKNNPPRLEDTEGKYTYEIKKGIPILLHWESEARKTQDIRTFYEETPFPNYDEFDDLGSLIDKSQKSIFARLLDEQIPFGTRVLECGCGTGQLTNFLAIAHREVVGIDLSFNSLRLAQAFKEQHQLDRAHFLQMNLWQPALQTQSFDLLIANGVLHHTPDPQAALKKILPLLKPKGYVLIGLYHRYARLWTNWQGLLYRGGWRRNPNNPKEKAWQRDQYQNPLESKHSIQELLNWFDELGLQFINCLPKPNFTDQLEVEERLFAPITRPNAWELALKEITLAWTHYQEGGFFMMIGRKIH